MNKQELEKQAEALYTDVRSFLDNTFELIDQIHEPQQVVLPKFVAEWIEYAKAENFPLRQALDHWSMSKELEKWFQYSYNQETLARGWLDGYEVEKEQLYIVEFPTGQQLYKNYPSGSSKEQIVIKFANPKDKDGHFIKRELEEAGFGWVFDCSGVKVVEVE